MSTENIRYLSKEGMLRKYMSGMLFLLLSATMLLLETGCGKVTLDYPYFELSATNMDFAQSGETLTLDIRTNTDWIARFSPDEAYKWLRMDETGGNRSITVSLEADENGEYDARSASVTFISGVGTHMLTVRQRGRAGLIVEGETEYYIGQQGGTVPVSLKQNVVFKVEIEPDSKSWIHPVETRGLVAENLAFRIDENISPEVRTGEISLKVTDPETGAVDPGLSVKLKITQQELRLTVNRDRVDFGQAAQRKYLKVYSTHRNNPFPSGNSVSDYDFAIPAGDSEWCTVEKDAADEELLWVAVSENTTGEDRKTQLTITSSAAIQTVIITQKPSELPGYSDRDVLTLQRATRGAGIPLIIMGDGFTADHLVDGGLYETTMRQAADYFFNIEPYRTYRDYFQVDMVAAESEKSGTGEVVNRFGSKFGSGTQITCDLDLCREYASLVNGIEIDAETGYVVNEALVIMVVNSPKYAGTTSMYSNGFSVALCPMSASPSPNDFEGLVHHEAGGHGFGLLEDEYIYYKDTSIPLSEKSQINSWKQLPAGFYRNVDFTDDMSQIAWSEFAGHPAYTYVGAYQGAGTYGRGIWRAERNSCMNNNVPYFNAPSRRAIINRILRVAGEKELTFSEFVRMDNVTPPTERALRSVDPAMPPLGRPQRIEVPR